MFEKTKHGHIGKWTLFLFLLLARFWYEPVIAAETEVGDSPQALFEVAQEAGARRVRPLAVSIAAHSELMRHAQEEFGTAVERTPMKNPDIPIIGNVSGKPINSLEEIKEDLKGQLTSRVRWTESIQYMVEMGVDTFMEFGSKDVLSGLIKRIDRKSIRMALGKHEDFKNLV